MTSLSAKLEACAAKESKHNKSCAGVLNFPHAASNYDVLTLICKCAAIIISASHNISHKSKTPQVTCKMCNDVGVWCDGSFGCKCYE